MSDTLEQTAKVADYLMQWKISNMRKPETVLPKDSFEGPSDRSYYLKNKAVRKFLQHEKQRFGINLGWTDDAEPETAKKVSRWFFTRNGKGDKPLSYGEVIAIGNGGDPSFLRYAERDVGINLDWSKQPVFEWKLLGGPVGQPVKAADYLAVYNEKDDECLVAFDRSAGADIGWPSSKTFTDQLEESLREAVRNHARNAYHDLLGRKE